jgi:hypothetical protein
LQDTPTLADLEAAAEPTRKEVAKTAEIFMAELVAFSRTLSRVSTEKICEMETGVKTDRGIHSAMTRITVWAKIGR